jgi:bacterioferritin-associated ferredoxin
MNRIVCKCMMVTEKDVRDLINVCPFMPLQQIKSALKIGTRCGSCNYKNSPLIDVNFADVLEHVKISDT